MSNAVPLCITTEHDRIYAWAKRFDARPVMHTPENRSYPLAFTIGPPGPGLIEATWDEFLAEFDRANVAFVYPEVVSDWSRDPTYQFVSLAALPELTASRKTTLIRNAI